MSAEQLDPESYQVREVFARYGAAMYQAQVMEAALKQALVLTQLSEKALSTIGDFDAAAERNFSATLGLLIRRLRPALHDDQPLQDELRLALSMRNQLAHHFFWDYAVEFTSTTGRDGMLTYCERAEEIFTTVTTAIERLVRNFSVRAGIDHVLGAENVETAAAEIKVRRAAGGPAACPRCGSPLEQRSRAGHDYRGCSTCTFETLT